MKITTRQRLRWTLVASAAWLLADPWPIVAWLLPLAVAIITAAMVIFYR